MKLAPARFPVKFEQLVFVNREMGKEPPDEIFRGLRLHHTLYSFLFPCSYNDIYQGNKIYMTYSTSLFTPRRLLGST